VLSFLSPLFLAGAAAAAVPIVLHLLKREPETRVKFAAVKLIKQAPVEHTDKRRLRELLLLALRVTALVLLAIAIVGVIGPGMQNQMFALAVVLVFAVGVPSAPRSVRGDRVRIGLAAVLVRRRRSH